MFDFQGLAQGLPVVLLAQLIGGALGGALAGRGFRYFSLGPFWNLLLGLAGGGAAAQGLLALGMVAPGSTPEEAVARGGLAGLIGGALVIVIFGLVRSMGRR